MHKHNIVISSKKKKKIYNFLRSITLLVPPSREEGHLNVDECAILVHQQLLNDSVKDVLDGCMLNAAIGCHNIISAC